MGRICKICRLTKKAGWAIEIAHPMFDYNIFFSLEGEGQDEGEINLLLHFEECQSP